MKRRIVTVLIFLLLGAIVNIAVAWVDVYFPSYLAASIASGPPTPQDQADWHKSAPEQIRDAELMLAPAILASGRAHLHTIWIAYAHQSVHHDPVSTHQHIVAGWPASSLSGERWTYTDDLTGDQVLVNRGTRAVTVGPFTLLPILPLWPGFAINTLFYAAILWLLFAAPFVLRRRRRIKRGLCPACAYPVGASDLCTECGNKLNITSKIAARQRMGLPPPATPASEAERKS